MRVGGGSNTDPTPTEATGRLTLLSLLMLTRRGINILPPSTEATGADTEESPHQQRQPMDDHADEDELDELLRPDYVEQPAPATTIDHTYSAHDQSLPRTATDLETGVPADISAMAYVAGFVARHSSLGQPSARSSEEPIEALWTRLRSIGGLTIPTAAFLGEFAEMDRQFCSHHAAHKDQLSREPGVIRRLSRALLRRHPRLSEKVVRRFARTRTFIRLRNINRKARAARAVKRARQKRASFAKSAKAKSAKSVIPPRR